MDGLIVIHFINTSMTEVPEMARKVSVSLILGAPSKLSHVYVDNVNLDLKNKEK